MGVELRATDCGAPALQGLATVSNAGVVAEKLAMGGLVELKLAFEKADILQGIDVVWSQNRHLGAAGNWMLKRLQDLDVATMEDG